MSQPEMRMNDRDWLAAMDVAPALNELVGDMLRERPTELGPFLLCWSRQKYAHLQSAAVQCGALDEANADRPDDEKKKTDREKVTGCGEKASTAASQEGEELGEDEDDEEPEEEEEESAEEEGEASHAAEPSLSREELSQNFLDAGEHFLSHFTIDLTIPPQKGNYGSVYAANMTTSPIPEEAQRSGGKLDNNTVLQHERFSTHRRESYERYFALLNATGTGISGNSEPNASESNSQTNRRVAVKVVPVEAAWALDEVHTFEWLCATACGSTEEQRNPQHPVPFIPTFYGAFVDVGGMAHQSLVNSMEAQPHQQTRTSEASQMKKKEKKAVKTSKEDGDGAPEGENEDDEETTAIPPFGYLWIVMEWVPLTLASVVERRFAVSDREKEKAEQEHEEGEEDGETERAHTDNLMMREPSHPFRMAEILGVASEILRALDRVHRQSGLVHLDLKPTNVLLRRESPNRPVLGGHQAEAQQATTELDDPLGDIAQLPEGSILLVDWGTAQRSGESCGQLGDFEYMSPEVYAESCDSYTEAHDIWALGCVLLFMCEGCAPLDHDYWDPHGIFEFLDKNHVSPMLKHTSRWNKEFVHFLALCFERDPALRPSAHSLLQHDVFSFVAEEGEDSIARS